MKGWLARARPWVTREGPAANVIAAVAGDALVLDDHVSAGGDAGVRIEDNPAANEQRLSAQAPTGRWNARAEMMGL